MFGFKVWSAECGGKVWDAKCRDAKCGAQSVEVQNVRAQNVGRKVWGIKYGVQSVGRKVGKPIYSTKTELRPKVCYLVSAETEAEVCIRYSEMRMLNMLINYCATP